MTVNVFLKKILLRFEITSSTVHSTGWKQHEKQKCKNCVQFNFYDWVDQWNDY